ncbi:MAG: type II toxin-antitoxin system prevent-host-death family antitoxin [Deltaproteobacteria bacterium]|nr:type II toxin-antitoxin system prevent-host-death family antitoxin [Deltaproteobacteria bacterium]MBW2046608.1 type II toxin-antitoxin system prevent-host-death family antitoxin [Deltaproteobacteria bacterium]
MKASAKDLRYKTKEIIAALERGEEVLLTYRGEEKAKIISVSKKSLKGRARIEERPLFGIWRANEKVANVDAYLDKVRGGRFGTR